jgi:hypothetical protein
VGGAEGALAAHELRERIRLHAVEVRSQHAFESSFFARFAQPYPTFSCLSAASASAISQLGFVRSRNLPENRAARKVVSGEFSDSVFRVASKRLLGRIRAWPSAERRAEGRAA